MSKVTITKQDLSMIIQAGIRTYVDTTVPNLDSSKLQAYLIIDSLSNFLSSKGLEVNFKLFKDGEKDEN